MRDCADDVDLALEMTVEGLPVAGVVVRLVVPASRRKAERRRSGRKARSNGIASVCLGTKRAARCVPIS